MNLNGSLVVRASAAARLLLVSKLLFGLDNQPNTSGGGCVFARLHDHVTADGEAQLESEFSDEQDFAVNSLEEPQILEERSSSNSATAAAPSPSTPPSSSSLALKDESDRQPVPPPAGDDSDIQPVPPPAGRTAEAESEKTISTEGSCNSADLLEFLDSFGQAGNVVKFGQVTKLEKIFEPSDLLETSGWRWTRDGYSDVQLMRECPHAAIRYGYDPDWLVTDAVAAGKTSFQDPPVCSATSPEVIIDTVWVHSSGMNLGKHEASGSAAYGKTKPKCVPRIRDEKRDKYELETMSFTTGLEALSLAQRHPGDFLLAFFAHSVSREHLHTFFQKLAAATDGAASNGAADTTARGAAVFSFLKSLPWQKATRFSQEHWRDHILPLWRESVPFADQMYLAKELLLTGPGNMNRPPPQKSKKDGRDHLADMAPDASERNDESDKQASSSIADLATYLQGKYGNNDEDGRTQSSLVGLKPIPDDVFLHLVAVTKPEKLSNNVHAGSKLYAQLIYNLAKQWSATPQMGAALAAWVLTGGGGSRSPPATNVSLRPVTFAQMRETLLGRERKEPEAAPDLVAFVMEVTFFWNADEGSKWDNNDMYAQGFTHYFTIGVATTTCGARVAFVFDNWSFDGGYHVRMPPQLRKFSLAQLHELLSFDGFTPPLPYTLASGQLAANVSLPGGNWTEQHLPGGAMWRNSLTDIDNFKGAGAKSLYEVYTWLAKTEKDWDAMSMKQATTQQEGDHGNSKGAKKAGEWKKLWNELVLRNEFADTPGHADLTGEDFLGTPGYGYPVLGKIWKIPVQEDPQQVKARVAGGGMEPGA